MMSWYDGRGETSRDARTLSEANEIDHGTGSPSNLLSPGLADVVAAAHAEHRSHLVRVRLWRRITRRR